MTVTSVLDADLQRPSATPGHASEVRDWTRLAVVLLSRMYRTFLLGLVVIAVAPVVLGWGSYVIRSGSMEPSVSVGDVVLAKPWTEDQPVRVGRVFVYDDPATTRPRLMVHRIVELRDDGDYTTAGDANDLTDVAPLPRSDIRATAVLLVPHVGLPVTWFQTGRWLPLATWLLLTVAAFALAARRLDGEPPRWRLLRILRDRFSSRPPPDGPTGSGGTGTGPGPGAGTAYAARAPRCWPWPHSSSWARSPRPPTPASPATPGTAGRPGRPGRGASPTSARCSPTRRTASG